MWSVGESASFPRIVAYPNPASDMVTVSVGPELVGTSYVLVDGQGAAVLRGKIETLEQRLPLDHLPQGAYTFVVDTRVILSLVVTR